MSSAKTERLVNLTMALLATKRYMPKSEIFRRVAGYSGELDAKERMFERDKDDLRELGIEIEVGGHDPLFEDEPGYRIRRERYAIAPSSFTAEELAIMATALSSWDGSTFASRARPLLRRLDSLNSEKVFEDSFDAAKMKIDEDRLLEVSEALANRVTIEFQYQKSKLVAPETRRANPLGVCAWRGAWYLVGEDLDKGDIRVYKLNRFASDPKEINEPGGYEIPDDFSVSDYVVMLQSGDYSVTMKVRIDSALALRSRAKSIAPFDDNWDLVEVDFASKDEAAREILWFAEESIVLEPVELREELKQALLRIVGSNG